MRAEILSCGTELLLGHITDTNATYLAQSLSALGIDLYFVSQVGDNLGRIVDTLKRAWERSELIIMTGGLGPTEDDLARESISTLLGETMQVDPKLEAELRNMFAGRHAYMPERNIKQATLIPSAQALPNPRGTAPGWWVRKDKHIIVAMPGVPREMYRMWEEEVVPRLRLYTGGLIFTRILRVSGLGESSVEEQLDSLLHNNNPTSATYAKADGIDVRITAKADSSEEAEKMVSAMEEQTRQLLGHHIFGTDKATLQGVIGDLLQAREQSLAVMESITGGFLTNTITNVPNSSQYFIGGVTAYSVKVKEQMGVSHEVIEKYGSISEEAACAMAHAIREHFGSDYAIATTGVAGPDEEEGKKVGTVYIAVEGPDGVVTTMGPGWRGHREDQKRFSVLAALNLLRLYLEGVKKPQ